MKRMSVMVAIAVAAFGAASVGAGAQASPSPQRGKPLTQLVRDPSGQPARIMSGASAPEDRTNEIPPAVATPTATGTGCTFRAADPNDPTSVNSYYCRAGVYQYLTGADGAYMSTLVQSPWVATGDYHSLAELAVLSKDSQQYVEIGWRVSPTEYKDQTPRLFVSHWVNNHFICYSNATHSCGFISTSSAVKPEMTLSATTTPVQFEIDYSGGNWWFGYNNTWFGYLPGSLWTSPTFTRAEQVQMYGEVASTKAIPCTNMGNGYLGTSPGSVGVNGIGYFNSTDTPVLTALSDDATLYNSQVTTTSDSFRYGGSGGRTTTACTTP